MNAQSGNWAGKGTQMVPWQPKRDGDPDQCGGFALTHLIDGGGFGTVFLGFHPEIRTPAAVKIFTSPHVTNNTWRRRFCREIELIRKMAGVHTAALLAANPEDDPPWLATRYVHAPPLHRLVRQYGVFDELPAWWLAASLGEALAEIHAKGILHRDLKPQNIMVESTGIQVIDFGISRFTAGSDITTAPDHFGTREYCANEHLLDIREATEKSDVFALGATLVWVTTGRTPFSGIPVNDRIFGMPPNLDGVPDSLMDLVESCLAGNADYRPTALEVFRKGLSHLTDHAVPLVSGTGLPLPAEVRDFVDAWAAEPIPVPTCALATTGGTHTTGTGPTGGTESRTGSDQRPGRDVFDSEWRGHWRRAAGRRRDNFGK